MVIKRTNIAVYIYGHFCMEEATVRFCHYLDYHSRLSPALCETYTIQKPVGLDLALIGDFNLITDTQPRR